MLHVILDVHSQMDTHMQARIWVKMHGSTCGFGSTKCAPVLFSELGFCKASCSSIYLSIYLYIYIYIYVYHRQRNHGGTGGTSSHKFHYEGGTQVFQLDFERKSLGYTTFIKSCSYLQPSLVCK